MSFPFLKLSNIIFTGNFHRNPIDETTLFNGKIDVEGRLITEHSAQCSYDNGLYKLTSFPDKIDLETTSPDIMPSELVTAAELIIAQLQMVKRISNISGFGMMCDTVIEKQLIQFSGQDYCFGLTKKDVLRKIAGKETEYLMASAQFTKDKFVYDVRIQPHFMSKGNNLFVAVLAHQDTKSHDSLGELLKHSDFFRDYMRGLYQRILAHEKEE